ncbi:hypothetical protein SCMC78_12510 [Streptomyces sp. CMC78]|uniref:Uncharacterized protein n=1 Tax=Streptomyces sp. CMC78 TaxID=3231512 RepID=A0AB33KD97_9ACTN
MLDLCDEVMGEPAERGHRFDWLLGDPGESGRQQKLPVDAYWPGHQLVVDYRGPLRDRPNQLFDKPGTPTVSGVDRSEQRDLYDMRRDAEIPTHGLRLVVIRPADLDADDRGNLRRNRESDLVAVQALLKS